MRILVAGRQEEAAAGSYPCCWEPDITLEATNGAYHCRRGLLDRLPNLSDG